MWVEQTKWMPILAHTELASGVKNGGGAHLLDSLMYVSTVYVYNQEGNGLRHIDARFSARNRTNVTYSLSEYSKKKEKRSSINFQN